MIPTMRAELVTYMRRRVLWRAVLGCAVLATAATAIVLAAAPDRAPGGQSFGATRASLATAGGGTEVFTTAMRFTGVFAFVVFIGLIASEFSRGTMRTMLLREPRRVHLLAGKVLAMIGFAAALLALTEVFTWLAALALAGANGIDHGAWVSAAGIGHGIEDYSKVLVWLAGYAIFGSAVAVLLRSVPVGLAVGIFWSGPLEHLLEDAWAPARRWFPGLLLEAFVAGGNPDVSAGRALLTAGAYAVVGATVAAYAFVRRDVTS